MQAMKEALPYNTMRMLVLLYIMLDEGSMTKKKQEVLAEGAAAVDRAAI